VKNTIKISQTELLRLAEQWEPAASTSPPEFRYATCVVCEMEMAKMWHLWIKVGGFRKELHMCRECGRDYGATYADE
jgi:hypothetical protein